MRGEHEPGAIIYSAPSDFISLLVWFLAILARKACQNQVLSFGRFMRIRKRRRCFPSCSSLHRVNEDEVYWRRKKREEELEWAENSSHLVSQLAQCLTNAMVGPRQWIGGLFNHFGKRNDKNPLSPIQEQRLKKLQERVLTPYEEGRPDHQEALKALWSAAFPDVPFTGFICEQWKEMGWQGSNPATDFRGCGFMALENLLFYARTYPASFRRLLLKQVGKRATWEYPFAVAGVNISFMLIHMLELYSEKPRSHAYSTFIKFLEEDEAAFDVLYCAAFELMDAQWLAMGASYMEFNDVLQVTRAQLERELALDDVRRVRDIPAYNCLYR